MAKNYLAVSFGLIGLLGYATAQASCGSTACSINTNWDEHSSTQPGWSADLRYTYSRADQLRSGTNKIAADTAFAGEVENLNTTNKIVTASVDYAHDEHWGVTLNLPYIMRDHAHNLGPYVGATPAGYESFSAKALGDIKVVGRYRWALDEVSRSGVGVKFGLKLNTGKKDFVIAQTGVKPNEVTLQPGNGSTDLIAGAFMFKSIPGSNWTCFAQGTVQSSISSSATFRPGNQINLDGGTRYAFSRELSGLLQLSAQWNATDSGTAAALSPVTGGPSSGGSILSLAPGLSYAFTPSTQLYGLVQLPLYQYVNGEQLTANSSFTIGLSHRF
ncbi:MAG: hypothetical protein KGJ19_04055 [Betaproteobacteria bacterium]|nr:hypothetical protein [Betaproteobacteria bacterium]MDE2311098.1 hypothetical protein [Betaproteobacteria bacterium]